MRSELNINTICSLMCAKQNQDFNCFEYEPTEELLKLAKKKSSFSLSEQPKKKQNSFLICY